MRHVLVDQRPPHFLRTEAHKTNHIDVVDPANGRDLTNELVSIAVGVAQHLDGYLHVAWE